MEVGAMMQIGQHTTSGYTRLAVRFEPGRGKCGYLRIPLVLAR